MPQTKLIDNLISRMTKVDNAKNLAVTKAFAIARKEKFKSWIPSNGGRLRFRTIADTQSTMKSSWAEFDYEKKSMHTIFWDLDLKDDFQSDKTKPICIISIDRESSLETFRAWIAIVYCIPSVYKVLKKKIRNNSTEDEVIKVLNSLDLINMMTFEASFHNYGLLDINLNDFYMSPTSNAGATYSIDQQDAIRVAEDIKGYTQVAIIMLKRLVHGDNHHHRKNDAIIGIFDDNKFDYSCILDNIAHHVKILLRIEKRRSQVYCERHIPSYYYDSIGIQSYAKQFYTYYINPLKSEISKKCIYIVEEPVISGKSKCVVVESEIDKKSKAIVAKSDILIEAIKNTVDSTKSIYDRHKSESTVVQKFVRDQKSVLIAVLLPISILISGISTFFAQRGVKPVLTIAPEELGDNTWILNHYFNGFLEDPFNPLVVSILSFVIVLFYLPNIVKLGCDKVFLSEGRSNDAIHSEVFAGGKKNIYKSYGIIIFSIILFFYYLYLSDYLPFIYAL